MKIPMFASASLLTLLTLLTPACAVAPGDEGLAAEEALTTSSALDTGLSSTELESLTTADASKAARSLVEGQTKGCKTRTIDPELPNVVRVTLSGCKGRLGKHVVNGEMIITFTSNPDGSLHAEHVSQNLTIDGRPASRRASADITLDGELRRVVRRGVKTGTSRRGDSFTKTTDEVVVVDRASRCRVINGSGIAVFDDGRRVESILADLRLCEDEAGVDRCPTGTITHVDASKDKKVTQRFDGSPVAVIDVSSRKGDESRLWQLDCASAP